MLNSSRTLRVLRNTTAPIFSIAQLRDGSYAPALAPTPCQPTLAPNSRSINTYAQPDSSNRNYLGPPARATGPVGKQARLLFLDSILHLSAPAIQLIVKGLSIPFQIRHHPAIAGEIATLARMLGIDQHTPRPCPNSACAGPDTTLAQTVAASASAAQTDCALVRTVAAPVPANAHSKLHLRRI